jgi:hypothetical protein
LSTIAGISSFLKASCGLPALATSSVVNSSARSSIASAIFSSASERSPGVVFAQPSNAARAAATALSTSAAVDSGACAIASPVAGLMTSSVWPSAGSTHSPPMKFR